MDNTAKIIAVVGKGGVGKTSISAMEAYQAKDEPWVGKMRHRAIVWSCPAHYYANFSNWAANCWGIDILVEMESLNFTKHLETSDKEEAMRDLARLYERMVMDPVIAPMVAQIRLGLGNFIGVVGEGVVDPAAVDVQILAQMLHDLPLIALGKAAGNDDLLQLALRL